MIHTFQTNSVADFVLKSSVSSQVYVLQQKMETRTYVGRVSASPAVMPHRLAPVKHLQPRVPAVPPRLRPPLPRNRRARQSTHLQPVLKLPQQPQQEQAFGPLPPTPEKYATATIT